MRSQYNHIPDTQGGGHKLENNILQKFSYRSQNSEPHVRLHSLGGLAAGRRAPRAFAFESQQGLIASTPQNWENGDSALGGHTPLMCTRIQEKSRDFMGAWARHTCRPWRASGGKHSRWLTHPEGKGPGWRHQGARWDALSGRPHLTPGPGAAQQPVAPALGRVRPRSQQGGNTAPRIGTQLTLDTALDTATRSSQYKQKMLLITFTIN